MQDKTVSGFSKWSKEEKVKWLAEHFFVDGEAYTEELSSFWHGNIDLQRILDGFSENTVSNYIIPYGIAPNFLINDQIYAIPMAIEESSVVAAASSAAKFWLNRGGFKAEVLSTKKLGQVHFTWKGSPDKLQAHFAKLELELRKETAYLTTNMEGRGGGVTDIELRDLNHLEPNYYQLMVSFETCDSMGANFINSVLEEFAQILKNFVSRQKAFTAEEKQVKIVMAILSNYTPDCLVHVEVECPVDQLKGACEEMDGTTFAEKFATAIRIANIDPYRATTHNKGIFNGVDAVVMATANDFRAVEACGHAYAARDGQYRSLSYCEIENGVFRFWLDLPLALGTVGGLTTLHPLAKRSLELLGNPSAEELMMIIATTGLAQNFAAVRSLVTTGIQQGHMKMHLKNILNHLGANESECLQAEVHFSDKVVSFSTVRKFLESIRNYKGQPIIVTRQ
ncbi:MAG: 3-hydroxy-3-methylglutaryl coenzyme A reductase [Saprospiraceae bacterium]|nr:MAG: 3-hydroxy-3-methylglutaryl coenzyme A reductase [Saprospiraceae bacterium]